MPFVYLYFLKTRQISLSACVWACAHAITQVLQHSLLNHEVNTVKAFLQVKMVSMSLIQSCFPVSQSYDQIQMPHCFTILSLIFHTLQTFCVFYTHYLDWLGAALTVTRQPFK